MKWSMFGKWFRRDKAHKILPMPSPSTLAAAAPETTEQRVDWVIRILQAVEIKRNVTYYEQLKQDVRLPAFRAGFGADDDGSDKAVRYLVEECLSVFSENEWQNFRTYDTVQDIYHHFALHIRTVMSAEKKSFVAEVSAPSPETSETIAR